VFEPVESAGVDGKPVGRELRTLISALFARRDLLRAFVRCFHKPDRDCSKKRMLISASMATIAQPTASRTSTVFQPYVSPTESPAEFTAKALLIGVPCGLLFGASTVH